MRENNSAVHTKVEMARVRSLLWSLVMAADQLVDMAEMWANPVTFNMTV